MQRFNDLKRLPDDSAVSASGEIRAAKCADASTQQWLDDIGGEPLAGSGFENEEPESEFAPAGEEI
jgi:hypothetical protein